MAKTLADGYVEIRPDVTKLGPELRKGIRKLDLAKMGRQAGGEMGAGLAKGFEERSGALARVAATTAARMTLMGSAAAAAAPGVLQLTAALAPAAGAAAALPAALLAIKAASATVKVAVMGVGEAIQEGFGSDPEAAAEALKKLPPEARKFAAAIVGMRDQLKGLQAQISNRFFAQFADQIKPLATAYFPVLNRQVPQLAGAMGGAAKQFALAARQGPLLQGVQAVLGGTTDAATSLAGAVRPAVDAFGRLLIVGAPAVRQVGASLASAAKRASEFISEAAQTGRLQQAMANGLATLRTLGGILANVGGIVRTVMQAATAGGSNLLTTLRDLTGQARDFLQSAEGGSALTGIFGTLGQLGQALRTSLGAVLPAVAQSVQALAPAVGGLAPVFADLVVAVAPLLPYFTQIAAAVLTALVPAVSALAGWLRDNEQVMTVLATTLGAVAVGMRLHAAYTRAAAVATGIHTAATKVWNSTALLRVRIAAIDAAAWIRSTAATAANTVATTANRVATAVSTAATTAFTAVKTFEFGAWVRSTAAMVANTAAMVASRVAMVAVRAATLAWTAVQWLLNAALTANPIGLVVAAIAALVAAVVLAYKKNETFRNIVNAVWSAIKTAIGAVVGWFRDTAWPAIKRVIDFLVAAFQFWWSTARTVWTGVWSAISTAWGWIRDKAFNPIKKFITETLPNAFRTGVDAIKGFWEKVKEAAKKPVEFVVNTVINKGIIGTFNKIAGWIPGVKPLPTVAFAAGGHYSGRLPGPPSDVDNMLATGPRGQRIALAGGEYVVNARATARNLPLLEAINEGLPGFADGGFLGFLRGPAKWIADRVGVGRIAEKFGANPLVGMLGGAVRSLTSGLVAKAKALIDGIGGGRGANGLTAQMTRAVALIRAAFPGMNVVSGLRPGAVTVTGNRSYHASGRATDWPASMALFNFMVSQFGHLAREIIYSPAGSRQIHNGRPHMYTGAVRDTHWDHVHLALASGGRIPFGSYDSGGYLPTGLSIAHNGTGRPEPVGHGLGARTYNITVNVTPGVVHPAEVGRQIVEAIKEFEQFNGARWRTA